MIKVVKRIAFGFTSFRNYRIRSLIYARKPNQKHLATVVTTYPVKAEAPVVVQRTLLTHLVPNGI